MKTYLRNLDLLPLIKDLKKTEKDPKVDERDGERSTEKNARAAVGRSTLREQSWKR